MNAFNQPDEHWTSCERGTLTRIGADAKARQRRQTAWRAAAWICSVLLVGVGVWMAVRPGPVNDQQFNFGGIACREVRANMGEYKMHRLPPKLSEQIAAHLKQCPACQEFMKNMPRERAAANGHSRLAACDCPTCRRRMELAMLVTREAPPAPANASLKVDRLFSIAQGN